MRYFFIEGTYVPKHCIYGPRQNEAILLNDSEWKSVWNDIHGWKRERQMAAYYASKEEEKRNLSNSITRNWQDTLASKKRLEEQKRVEDMEKERREKINKYNEILESRKEERSGILANSKRMLFEAKDSTKTLTTALEKCAVITEQRMQIEFKKKLKELEARRDNVFLENMKVDVENYRRELKEQKEKEAEKKRDYKETLTKQLEERRKLREETEEKRRKLEQEDALKMLKNLENLKKCEEKERQDRVRRAKMTLEKSYFVAELEKSLAAEEEEENEVNAMINKYAKRFAKEKAKREAEIIAESIAARRRLTDILTEGMRKRMEMEQAITDKALREKEEQAEKKANAQEEARTKAKSDMLAWEAKRREEIAAEKNAQNVTLKWTILQNEKTNEIDAEWRRDRKKRLRETQMNTRRGYDAQIREKQQLEQVRNKEALVIITGREKDKQDFYKYCDEVVNYARQRGWNHYPLLKTIATLKKDYEWGSQEENQFSNHQQKEKCEKPTGLFCYCFKN